ncbi:hypothetical protein Plhal304r1_c042g0120631 [Plasmopara halstedii]
MSRKAYGLDTSHTSSETVTALSRLQKRVRYHVLIRFLQSAISCLSRTMFGRGHLLQLVNVMNVLYIFSAR